MKLSFIVPYRNRAPHAVQKCLQSLHNQDFDSFEIIFLDYGSDPEISQEMRLFCENLSAVRYFYAETRGWLWCKPHALNLAYAQARGEFLVMVDADMIHPSKFAEKLLKYLHTDKIVHYRCRYLPENYAVDMKNIDYNQINNFILSDEHATGLFVVSRQKMMETGGSNEFYMIWGMEDTDASQRLQNAKLSLQWLDLEETTVLHQWHPVAHQNAILPYNWRYVVRDYGLKYGGEPAKKYYDIPNGLEIRYRPALELVNSESWNKLEQYQLKNPLQSAFLEFEHLFENQEFSNGIYIEYAHSDFENIQSNTGRITSLFNNFLAKTGTGYRLINQDHNLTFITIRDFLYYFILFKRHWIRDYHFDVRKDFLRLLIFSK